MKLLAVLAALAFFGCTTTKVVVVTTTVVSKKGTTEDSYYEGPMEMKDVKKLLNDTLDDSQPYKSKD